MQEKVNNLREQIISAISSASSSKELYELKMRFLGRQGEVTSLLKGMKDVPADQRPVLGKVVNELSKWAENEFESKEVELKKLELQQKYASEQIDISMPAKFSSTGTLHPNTLVKNELINIFAGMGFEIFEGPELENDYYNFEALNTPADHPARDMQDTFYITEKILLRTQTSAGQIRVMENKQPPIKILSPGKVYRSDDDATHSPMFSQMEGLVVDKGITLCDLKGMLDEFARNVFDSNTKTRLRPSYFPFTEPSVEIDISCSECGGKGCHLCKGTGWIEVLGAGMVNRKVLENCGIDPDVYSGFAFGMGIERIAMLKYGINNMKYLFENDVRLLKQFKF